MITIVPKFNKADIARMLQARQKQIEDACILRMKRIGETFLSNARDGGNYKDRTGNLRSSKGYVILHNGTQIFGAFPGQTDEGRKSAHQVIDRAKTKFPTGIVLIGVAGMEYAAAVESKGYDVITGSSLIAIDDLNRAIKELSSKVTRL